ncbi:MAG: 50S ribosomal protein L4 [Gammaproteobacteria bacterium]|nr:50S ribosomal protein L4 [Gammaproteobacteria bacterium]
MEIKQANGGSLSVDAGVFDCLYNPTLIHQATVAFQARARAGTKAQKNRSAVAGGASKPWRQKGMGRARAGTIRSPLWRGGGRTFAAQPRNFNQKLNKKMYRGALKSLLSELNRLNRLVVIDELTIAKPKTKLLVEQLKTMALDSVLIVLAEENEDIFMASRNIPKVGVLLAHEIDPVNLMRFDKVLVTREAIEKIQENLQ